MAKEKNFLLGRGELLAAPVVIPSGGGDKNPPYDFRSAQGRIVAKLATLNRELHALPGDACPNGQAVAVLTLHPRYISKSDFPAEFLKTAGLRSIGSRSRVISPDQWGIKKPPPSAVAEDLFIAGSRDAFAALEGQVSTWAPTSKSARQLATIEDIASFSVDKKLRGIPQGRHEALFEVVLHNGGDDEIPEAFAAWSRRCNAEALLSRRRDVGGLSFVPVRASTGVVRKIASFAFVRVLRGMPTLRPFRPGLLREVKGFAVSLPTGKPLDGERRVAIFDGGLPSTVDLSPWVNYIEPKGIGAPVPSFQDHGLAVTTAFLFGSLSKGEPLQRPMCPVDHVRVLDARAANDQETMYLDVLDRILHVLDKQHGRYRLVNISLGPRLAVDDDDITRWTAEIDKRLGSGDVLVTVAAGNDGDMDEASGLNRIQPPADAVNVLSVGACDSHGDSWARAEYSCKGPGRSPGIVKPDGVAFGGANGEPFMVLGRDGRAAEQAGTSFAAPLVLRAAAGIAVQLADRLSPLATRALLIDRADPRAHSRPDVGWGRFEVDPAALITCNDDEALVVYQGDLPVGEHLRARLPMPHGALQGSVELAATLCITPEIDPEHAGTYTRSGFEVFFRPKAGRTRTYGNGKQSAHAATKPFFSAANLYGAPEYSLRADGDKWEPCRRHAQTFRASTLKDPCFDIYYHHRESGVGAVGWEPKPIRYALIVGLRTPKVPDLYNRVVRTYANVLVPLRPQIQVPIRVRS